MVPTSTQRSRPWLTASFRSLAVVGCAGCHGENGVSEIENTPSLAGQPDLFIQWPLIFFRSGARKNEVMGPIAEQLSNDGVCDLGAHFASLQPPNSTAASAPDDHLDLTEAGHKVAAAGRCVSFHAEKFAGSKAVARIAGQQEEYITKAPLGYKSGLRSGGGVAAMAEVAYPLSDDEITTVAHNLARL
jgi:cytochrome c553